MHRSLALSRDGRQSNGASGRHDADAGVSGHDDRRNGDAKPEPISMGIIVNFTKQTVHGFGDPFFGEQLIKITGITETAVYFGATDKLWNTSRSVMGSIDRVTGDVWVDATSSDAKTGKTITSTSYALKCRPAQRMF
jgi:hypothetical protein